MRRLIALTLLPLLVLAVACVPKAPPAPARNHAAAPTEEAWERVFADDFDGTTLNAANWTSGYKGRHSPINSYEYACYDPSALSVSDGNLNITSRYETRTCGGVTRSIVSGNLDTYTKFSIAPTAGHPVYVEARLDLPAAGDGSGQVANWPAFWLNAVAGNWPNNGELDVMEGLGNDDAEATWHGPTGQKHIASYGRATGWHTFGVLWTTSSVRAYLDGQPVDTAIQTDVTSPQFIILGQQYGPYGDDFNTVPATMRVDYVAAWRVR